ncbi:MAG: transposase [Chloroflexi bacterium]|nr:transposase [Chloroflexota bacterium]
MSLYSAIGVDIGKDSLTFAFATDSRNRSRWPVRTITYDNPDWHLKVLELIAPDAIICAEPTGWHYLTPLLTVIEQMTTAHLWLASHDASRAARQSAISASKTDEMDARALAYIADRIAHGDPPRNVRAFDSQLEQQVLTLRLYVNKLARLTRESTRLQNQIDAFAHSLWPLLAQRKKTYLRLAERGILTPRQIKNFAVMHIARTTAERKADGWNGQTLRFIDALARDLPDIEVNPVVAATLHELLVTLRANDAQEVATCQVIHAIVQQPPFAEVTRRWMTIPACTLDYCAAFHVATHGQAEQYTADMLKAVTGINPLAYSSGQKDSARQSRKGYRPALNAVWTWAMHLVNPRRAADNPVRDYYTELTARNHAHAFTATRNKLVRNCGNRNPHRPRFLHHPHPAVRQRLAARRSHRHPVPRRRPHLLHPPADERHSRRAGANRP